jgi:hypothetical protein
MRFLHLAATATLLTGLITVLASCSGIKSNPNSYSSHAEYLSAGQQVTCSECHENEQKGTLKEMAFFSHTPVFVKNHGHYAATEDRLCASCHKSSFCTDCHASRSEIKPPTMYGDRPDRDMPHRGNFMTLHKIEGKLDPASCFRCHGRSNNERCNSCHH